MSTSSSGSSFFSSFLAGRVKCGKDLTFSGSGGSSLSGGSASGDSDGSSGDAGEQVADVGSLESLGEHAGPVSIDLVAGGSDDLGELVSLRA